MIATGRAKYPGPLICDTEFLQGMYGTFGGQAKCSKDDSTLAEELTQMLPMCMQQLQPLYDLQKSLVECTTEVKAESSEIEQGSQAIAELSKEAEDCQAKVEEKKQEQQTESIKDGFAFCSAQQDALIAAMTKWQAEVKVCIADKIPKITIEVEVPRIDIPVINASIDIPDIKVPDFTMPSFDSNIVIPGGGDKLNVAFDWKQSRGPPKLLTLDERIAKVRADVAKCEETQTTIPAKKEKMQQATAQATEQKTKMCAEVGSMLQLDVADQLSTADPSEAAKVQINILQAFKDNPFMSCESAIFALDAFITVLKLC
jgi:seryl-tRNA synthetase